MVESDAYARASDPKANALLTTYARAADPMANAPLTTWLDRLTAGGGRAMMSRSSPGELVACLLAAIGVGGDESCTDGPGKRGWALSSPRLLVPLPLTPPSSDRSTPSWRRICTNPGRRIGLVSQHELDIR